MRGPGEVTAKFSRPTCVTSPWKSYVPIIPKFLLSPFTIAYIISPSSSCLIFVNIPTTPVRRSQKFPRHLWSSTDLRSLARTASSPPRSLRSFSEAERSHASRRSLFSCSTEILEMCPKKTMVMFFVPITPEKTMDISHYKALITVKGYNCGKALVSSNK